uniref:Uncharacterized protein n=1 Tax=Arundo donax TaxID=35708 RepID=A0A0A8Z8F5_ARUDO
MPSSCRKCRSTKSASLTYVKENKYHNLVQENSSREKENENHLASHYPNGEYG